MGQSEQKQKKNSERRCVLEVWSKIKETLVGRDYMQKETV